MTLPRKSSDLRSSFKWVLASLLCTAVIGFQFTNHVLPHFTRFSELARTDPSLQFWFNIDKQMPSSPSKDNVDLFIASDLLGCTDKKVWGALGAALAQLQLNGLWKTLARDCIVSNSPDRARLAAASRQIQFACKEQQGSWAQMKATLLSYPNPPSKMDRELVQHLLAAGDAGDAKIADICLDSANGSALKSGLLALSGYAVLADIDRDYKLSERVVRDPLTLVNVILSVSQLSRRSAKFQTLSQALRIGVIWTTCIVLTLCLVLAPRWCAVMALSLFAIWFAMLCNLDFALKFPALRYSLVSNWSADTLSIDAFGLHLSLWPPALCFVVAMCVSAAIRLVPVRHQTAAQTLNLSGYHYALLAFAGLASVIKVGGSATVAIIYVLTYIPLSLLLAHDFELENMAGVSRNGTALRFMLISLVGIALLAGDQGHALALAFTVGMGALFVGSTAQDDFRTRNVIGLHVWLALTLVCVGILFMLKPEDSVFNWILEKSNTASSRTLATMYPNHAEVSDYSRLNAWSRSVANIGFTPFEVPWAGLDGTLGLPLQSPSDYVLVCISGWLGTRNAFLFMFAWLGGCVWLATLALHRAVDFRTRRLERSCLLVGALWLLSIAVRGAISLGGASGISLMTGVAVSGLSNGLVSASEFMTAIALVLPNLKK